MPIIDQTLPGTALEALLRPLIPTLPLRDLVRGNPGAEARHWACLHAQDPTKR